jgi:S-adenosylmethionine decarboxylase proenzyme
MTDYIELIRDRVSLKEGITAIERVLGSLYFHAPISTKELARNSMLPVPVVTAMKKEGMKLGIVMQQNGVILSELGRKYLEERFGYDGLDKEEYEKWVSIAKTADRKTPLSNEFSLSDQETLLSITKQLEPIYGNRPTVDVTLDQAYGTPDTGIRRALLALKKDTLLGKNLLCVGDDDLISLALGFLLRALYSDFTKNRTRIFVLEKDERLAAYIRETAKEYQLPITCVETDLRDPLPIQVVGHFDCFYTDPPYTIEGLSLFLSRGIGGLKKEKGLPIFLSFGQKPNEEVFRMQEVFLAHGLVLTGIFDGFNQYEGASLYGNVSRMLVLETTVHTKAVIPVTMAGMEKIYTGDFRAVGTKYRCRGCKQEITTGKSEAFPTIEMLKEAGCPFCGGKLFDRIADKWQGQEQGQKQGEKHGQEPGQEQGEKTSVGQYKRRALGEHILADFFGCQSEILNDAEQIGAIMTEAAKRANATIVTQEFHRFSPCGVSGAIIIQESHLTIHTWPEYQYAAVDIFTCGESLALWKAMEYLKVSLKADTMQSTELGRGFFPSVCGTDHDKDTGGKYDNQRD